LPRDVMEGPAPSEHPGPSPRPHLGCPAPAAVAEAAERINRARVPVLCLGMQASAPVVAAAVRAVLKKTPLPVVCTYQGAGVVPRDLLSCFAGRVGLSHNQPADRLLDAADVIVTIEDHALMGGYGSAVLELLNEKGVTTPVVRIGWPDQFIEHASTQDELRRKYGLTVENAVAKVKAQFDEAATRVTRLIEVA